MKLPTTTAPTLPMTADAGAAPRRHPILTAGLLLTLAACGSPSGSGPSATLPSATMPATNTPPDATPPAAASSGRPVRLVPKVDLARYAGDWYVIGAIPTSFEDEAYNPKESYRLDAEGRMVTTFTFNQGGFTGPQKTYTSTGYILDKTTNAVWGQQYIWPIKADYRISHLSPDYQQVVVTREKRDYAWIMARTPTISDADYQRLAGLLKREGYDTGKLRRMPQGSGK